ncbi:hypothetical protein C8R42DRAFT_55680 [Lentinula raphanica]|nr:hypothetical protein C8R42DRAFT_55680 [Lentinula raphanica]
MFPHYHHNTRHTDASNPYTVSSPSQISHASPTAISIQSHPLSSPLPLLPPPPQSTASHWGSALDGHYEDRRFLSESGQGYPGTTGLLDNTAPEELVIPATPRRRTVPLPSQVYGDRMMEIMLNPALICDETEEGRIFDVATAGSTTAILQLDEVATDPVFEEWATNPPLPSLSLVHPNLPWSITVHATETYVTVGDVFRAICQSLHLPLHRDYWWIFIGPDDGQRERVGRSLKRLHLLHGKTRFSGLSRTTAEVEIGEDIWRMNFI